MHDVSLLAENEQPTRGAGGSASTNGPGGPTMGNDVENLNAIERPVLSYPSNGVHAPVHVSYTHVCTGCFERWRLCPLFCICDQYLSRCLHNKMMRKLGQYQRPQKLGPGHPEVTSWSDSAAP